MREGRFKDLMMGRAGLIGMEPGAMEQTGEDIMTAMIAEFER